MPLSLWYTSGNGGYRLLTDVQKTYGPAENLKELAKLTEQGFSCTPDDIDVPENPTIKELWAIEVDELRTHEFGCNPYKVE